MPKRRLQSVDPVRTASGERGLTSFSKDGWPAVKAPDQNASDSEGRRLGERIGLDTRVALAVNYADCGVAVASGRRSAVA